MEKRSWVYIITNKPNGTLYIGVTSDLARRIHEHRAGLYSGFSKKYGLKILVWYEEYPSIVDAIHQEKRIKQWNRSWKKQEITKLNPEWRDLYEDFNK